MTSPSVIVEKQDVFYHNPDVVVERAIVFPEKRVEVVLLGVFVNDEPILWVTSGYDNHIEFCPDINQARPFSSEHEAYTSIQCANNHMTGCEVRAVKATDVTTRKIIWK
jgi:hypothetical protein